MWPLFPSQIRLAVFTSLPSWLPVWLRGVTAPGLQAGLCIVGIVLAMLLAAWLTGLIWLALLVGVAGMVLAARHAVGILAAAHDALDQAEQRRVAMEQALCRSQKMEALGRLAVGAAHDFNNHLTVISSNVEMVIRRLDGTQQHLRRHTDAALQGVQRAAALSGFLLSFSRRPMSEPEPVDVDRLLKGLSDLLRRTLGDRIGLDVRLSDEPWFAWADVSQMENALLSLVVNACDHVRTGTKLTIAVSNVHLDATAYPSVPPGEYLQITVSEPAGAGKPGIWWPTDDRSSADLSLVRAFVREASGFLLRLDSSSAGLPLRLFLPRYVPPALAAPVSRHDTHGRPTILMVDDDDAVRASCVEMLRELDYEVLEAPDAMEAFRLIADHGGIDLLFTDLGLPGGVSGRALADAARNVDVDIRVLFTTGFERADLPDRADTALLRKPFNREQLTGMVRDALAAQRPVLRSEMVRG